MKNTMSFQDPKDLTPSDALHLSNAVRITKNDTDLRRCQPLLRELADVLPDLKNDSNKKRIESRNLNNKNPKSKLITLADR